jgi:uncharacterized integral membrane protein
MIWGMVARGFEPMRLLKYLILAPVAALILVFAFANREPVTIYFDPIGGHGLDPVQAPEYVALLLAMALGVVAGSAATWIGQGRRRRAARNAQAEVARLRQELQAARFALAPALVKQA